jgi:hypothetical protein
LTVAYGSYATSLLYAGQGGGGAVRIVWAGKCNITRRFPSTNVSTP